MKNRQLGYQVQIVGEENETKNYNQTFVILYSYVGINRFREQGAPNKENITHKALLPHYISQTKEQ